MIRVQYAKKSPVSIEIFGYPESDVSGSKLSIPGCFSGEARSSGDRHSAYQNTPSLANPRNDATEMGKVLKRIGFDVDVVVDATKPQMDQALRRRVVQYLSPVTRLAPTFL